MIGNSEIINAVPIEVTRNQIMNNTITPQRLDACEVAISVGVIRNG